MTIFKLRDYLSTAISHLRNLIDGVWGFSLIYIVYFAVILTLHYMAWDAIAEDWLSTPLVIAFIAVTLGVVSLTTRLAPDTAEALCRKLSEVIERRWRLALALLFTMAIAIPAVVAFSVLDCFPNSGDEYAYLFQANQLKAGRLWVDAPPLDYTFVPYRTWIIGEKWLSQYPPGWPAVIAAAMVAGIPAWMTNALIGAAGVGALVSPLWRYPSRAATIIGAWVYILTPFYIMNAASFFSHTLTALLILLFCLSCLWYQRDRRILPLAASGVILGLIGITRYFTLILMFPALCHWLFVDNRRDWFKAVTVMSLAGLPFLGLLMVYQYLVTGSPIRTTYALIAASDTFISISPGSILRGAALTFDRLKELEIWASPLLPFAYLISLGFKFKYRSIAFYDLIFPCFIAGYVFFPDLGGNRYGPRYYYDAFPLMIVTIISAMPHVLAWVGSTRWHSLVANVVAATLIYLLTGLPFVSSSYHRQVEARQEPYRLALMNGLENAIVIIKSSSGKNLLAEDLTRNEPGLQASILYARAIADPEELRRIFPHRSIWAYVRKGKGAGRLELVLP